MKWFLRWNFFDLLSYLWTIFWSCLELVWLSLEIDPSYLCVLWAVSCCSFNNYSLRFLRHCGIDLSIDRLVGWLVDCSSVCLCLSTKTLLFPMQHQEEEGTRKKLQRFPCSLPVSSVWLWQQQEQQHSRRKATSILDWLPTYILSNYIDTIHTPPQINSLFPRFYNIIIHNTII